MMSTQLVVGLGGAHIPEGYAFDVTRDGCWIVDDVCECRKTANRWFYIGEGVRPAMSIILHFENSRLIVETDAVGTVRTSPRATLGMSAIRPSITCIVWIMLISLLDLMYKYSFTGLVEYMVYSGSAVICVTGRYLVAGFRMDMKWFRRIALCYSWDIILIKYMKAK